MLVFLAGGNLAGCRSAAVADPAAVYQNISSDVIHGNLDTAKQEAEKARKEFSASPDWAIKFRVLEADILTYQGRRPDVLALLNDPKVSYPATGDLAIKRNLLCGLADARLGQAQKADRELQEAQQLIRCKPFLLERRGSPDRSRGSELSRPGGQGRGPVSKKSEGRP